LLSLPLGKKCKRVARGVRGAPFLPQECFAGGSITDVYVNAHGQLQEGLFSPGNFASGAPDLAAACSISALTLPPTRIAAPVR
jgi:hypothetical protein